jgi:hypothetical protein
VCRGLAILHRLPLAWEASSWQGRSASTAASGSISDTQLAENAGKRRYSNQDSGPVEAAVSEALAALSAQEAPVAARPLSEKFAALRASGAQPRAIRNQRRRARLPGWVLDSVCQVLADQATGPMRVTSVHAAVEALVGETVSKDSVSWVLSSHSAGPSPLFVRVARGRYMLAGAP